MTITPNEKQQECINTINGPVMVLAGPGTGKTFTIIKRIKHMIEQNIEPSSILCLTYSEAAANEMKGRLVKDIGAAASAVCVNTYHAFCNDVIKQNPAEFELLDGVGLIDDITKRNIMQETLDEIKPENYRTKWGDYYYFIPEHLKSVDEIKSNRVTKEEYFNTLNTHPDWQGKMDELEIEYKEREQKGKLVKTFLSKYEGHKKKIEKAKEVWEIYERYDIKLKQNNYIDFNDMINMVLEVFEGNEDFLKKTASGFKYFLVDEYQDTNYAQNSIVFNLARGADSDNIFVVGDDDQIIYEFQGAKTDTLEKFLLLYPDTKVICLNENNRSTQNILDFSYGIISQDETRLEFNPEFKKYNISKVLTAKNKDIIPFNKKIQLHGFQEQKQENNFVITKIEEIISSGELPLVKNVIASDSAAIQNKEIVIANDNAAISDNLPIADDNGNSVIASGSEAIQNEKDLSKIAILTRENSEAFEFAKLLESKNIKYQIKTNKNIFDIKSSLVLYFYLKALLNNKLYADKLFGLLLTEPFTFDYEDYNFLLSQNRLTHKDLITNIKDNLTSRNWKNNEKVKSFIKTFDELTKLKSALNVKDLIISVINKTGILNYYVKNEINRSDNIYALKKIIEEAASHMKIKKAAWLGSFLEHIDTAFESNIPIYIDKEDYKLNAVQIVTLHGSKGREFDYVFMPNLISKKWEGKRVNNTMSLPIDKNDSPVDEEKRRRSEQLRLLFVGITRAKHTLIMSYSNSIDGSPQELTKYLETAIKDENIVEAYSHEMTKDEYLAEIAKGIKEVPFDYSSNFADELRARLEHFTLSPSSLNDYLACPRKFLYSQVLNIPVYDKETARASYGSAIHKVLQMSVQKAKTEGEYPSLDECIEFFKNCIGNTEFDSQEERDKYTENGIKCLNAYHRIMVLTPPERIFATEFRFAFVPFENKFLKGFIDRIEKNDNGEYEVYDYKTGSAKPKSQIADGKDYECYLNQLRFYKYAFELQNPETKVSSAGLIFVEEPENSRPVELTDDDNKIIKEKIEYAYENIDKLNFNPPEKDKRNCLYCDYIHLCKLNEM